MPEVHATDQPEQPTAVIRESVPMQSLTEFFGRAFGTVAAIADEGWQMAGPLFAKYYGMPTDIVDLEAGFAVSAPIQPTGDVQPGALPGGKVYEAVHIGPYDTLEQTYNAIMEQMTEDGVEPADVMWEAYLTDPESEPDPAKWQTQVYWPVRG